MSTRIDEIRQIVDRHLDEDSSDDELFSQHLHLMPELETELRKFQFIRQTLQNAAPTDSDRGEVDDTADGRIDLSDPQTTELPSQPVVPDYELTRLIGSGGFGQVWLGQNRLDNEYYAIKIFSQQLETELEGVRVYKSRARDHAGLVPIEHVGTGDGFYYYVMPLADNANASQGLQSPDRYEPLTLQTCIDNQQPISVDEAFTIGQQIAEALRQLHEAGVTRCDVKPSNIMKLKGTWRLGDLGLIARSHELSIERGTKAFWPPEGPGEPAADFYALGKSLDFAFAGGQITSPKKIEFVRPKDLRSQQFVAVILQACDERPEHRFQTAQQFRSRLRAAESTAESQLEDSGTRPQLAQSSIQRIPGIKWKLPVAMAGFACVAFAAHFLWEQFGDEPHGDRRAHKEGHREPGGNSEPTTPLEFSILDVSITNSTGETRTYGKSDRDHPSTALQVIENPMRLVSGETVTFSARPRRLKYATLLHLRPDGAIEAVEKSRGHQAEEAGQQSEFEWNIEVSESRSDNALFGLVLLVSDTPFQNWTNDPQWERHNREIGWHPFTSDVGWSIQRLGSVALQLPHGVERQPSEELGRVFQAVVAGIHGDSETHAVFLPLDRD